MRQLTLREIQEGSFGVLLILRQRLEELGLCYYLAYGTLLGAVRHKGFIPWDDDIDIWMPRTDYERFVLYCISHEKEMAPYRLFHYRTCDNYIYPIARFSDTRYTVNYNNARQYGLGLFVDIYPMDGLMEQDRNHVRQLDLLRRKINIAGSCQYVKAQHIHTNLIKYPYFLYSRYRSLTGLLRRVDKLARKYSFSDAEMIACCCWTPMVWYRKEWLGEGANMLLFCGEEFRVPADYNAVLTREYGNYMELPPETERVGHHDYSVFEK